MTDDLPADAQAVQDPQPDPVDQLRIERDGLRAERDEVKELLLRRQAEFDNFRKRTEKERSEYVQYAGMEMVREMLPILDDFDRALKVEGGSPEYTKGVEMIYNRMCETLKKLGLEPIETAGQGFRSASAPGGRAGGNEGSRRRHHSRRISARLQFQRQTAAAFHGEGSGAALKLSDN